LVYFANEAHPGSVLEVFELRPGSLEQRFFGAVRNASVDWEGSEPIRRIPLPA
jgi:hypothetical protein